MAKQKFYTILKKLPKSIPIVPIVWISNSCLMFLAICTVIVLTSFCYNKFGDPSLLKYKKAHDIFIFLVFLTFGIVELRKLWKKYLGVPEYKKRYKEDRRCEPRIKCSLAFSYSHKGKKTYGNLKDYSNHGLCFRSPIPVLKGERLKLSNQNLPLSFNKGMVCWIKKLRNGEYLTGVMAI